MLTLTPGSSCDVCAEEYGPALQPHSIPCGHILCAPCCNTIIEKTSPRLTPVCPFCRETFTNDAIRLIRIDFTSYGYSTPRRRGPLVEDDHDQAPSPTTTNDLASRKEERILLMDASCSRTRADARRLEDKVAKVAAKKCSVEEVSTLHRELQEWLTGEVNDQTSSLYLSAALLRAILMNHVAHSEASKNAKVLEATLRGRLDDMEITNTKLEAELRRQRVSYSQKVQECQSIGQELNRLKMKSSNTTTATYDSARSPLTPPTSPPPPPALHAPSARSPLSRFSASTHVHGHGHGHMRSASVQPQSVPGLRSGTPSVRSATPGAHLHHPLSRSDTLTPRPPPMPTNARQRRLSTPSPPPALPHHPMARTSSNSSEDDYIHERWIPQRAPSRSSASRSAVQQPYRYASAPVHT